MNNQEEVWLPVKGYESIYKVSNLGRVKVLNRISKDGKIWKGKMLLLSLNSSNYLTVRIGGKTKYVHQLVAEAFLKHIPCGKKIVVDHINNDSKDNRLINLQLISHRKNLSKDKKETTSDYTGVYWNKQNKKWHSQIYINGKSKHLGLFSCEKEASIYYEKELKKLEYNF